MITARIGGTWPAICSDAAMARGRQEDKVDSETFPVVNALVRPLEYTALGRAEVVRI